jgi:hypothetical protein
MSLPCGSLSKQYSGTGSLFDQKGVNASLGFRSFDGAQRTIQGYEAMHMIRKGQVRWLEKDEIAKQVRFIKFIFGLIA